MGTDIDAARREFSRSRILERKGGKRVDRARLAVAQAADAASQNFWRVFERIAQCATPVPLTADTIRLMNEVRNVTSLRPGDAAVLATASELARRGRCNRLLSNDSGFLEPTVKAWMTRENITLVRNAAEITGPISAAPGGRGRRA